MVMRRVVFLVFSLVLWTSCGGNDKPERPEVEKEEFRPLIVEGDDGKYTEWYPGHKQIKISGRNDKDGNRAGIWKYFSEQGVELSITIYNKGAKDGHIIVKYPSGAIHYTGEYLDDEPIGEWKFYNEDGQLKETKNYSE